MEGGQFSTGVDKGGSEGPTFISRTASSQKALPTSSLRAPLFVRGTQEVWIRDRDTKFVGPFDEVMTSIGARVINTPVRAPRANAFAERFVRTVRIECLDWLLVRNERHLERVLVEFVDHYNEARPHRGIDLEVPAPYTSKALFDDTSRITRVDRLGGLIREYSIAA
jgi:hypothetical protein